MVKKFLIDRWEALPDGPWKKEPGIDYVEEYEIMGYPAMIKRSHSSGGWCGYLKIPLDSFYTIEENYDNLDVHGGITASGIAGDSSGFILGFDCCHADDISPFFVSIKDEIESMGIKCKFDFKPLYEIATHKDIDFCRNELKKLAAQVAIVNKL